MNNYGVFSFINFVETYVDVSLCLSLKVSQPFGGYLGFSEKSHMIIQVW